MLKGSQIISCSRHVGGDFSTNLKFLYYYYFLAWLFYEWDNNNNVKFTVVNLVQSVAGILLITLLVDINTLLVVPSSISTNIIMLQCGVFVKHVA